MIFNSLIQLKDFNTLITIVLYPLVFIVALMFGNGKVELETFFMFLVLAVVQLSYNWKIIIGNVVFIGLIYIGAIYVGLNKENMLINHTSLNDIVISRGLPLLIFIYIIIQLKYTVKKQSILLEKKQAEIIGNNQTIENLVRQNNQKTKLIEVLAHDVRGPAFAFKDLTKKVSFLLKKDDYDTILSLGNYFEMAGEKLFSNLDNTLNWVIAQKEKIKVNKNHFSIDHLFNEVVSELNYAVTKKEILILNYLDSNLIVFSDRNILKVIVRNLVDNAIKYTPIGSVIMVAFEVTEDNLQLIIKDQGTGIDEDLIRNLYLNRTPIHKINSNSHGIGLQTCLFFAEALNIDLKFKTRKDKGTIVKIRIPNV
jgi:two-component system, sensor histidine kinase and response regulator